MTSKILLPILISGTFMMESIDSAILGTILPTIAREFGTDPVNIKLSLNAYFLAMAALIPASGWLSDVIGARRTFTLAIVFFVLGSVVCGFSANLETLVLARLLQGIGGAMMFPVGRMILIQSVEKRHIVQASSMLTIPSALAVILGPIIAGYFATYSDWRILFFINVPLGALGVALSLRLVPLIKTERRRFDAKGFAACSTGLAALGFGLTSVSGSEIALELSLALTMLGGILLSYYVLHASRTPLPILNLRLFRHRTFLAAASGSFLSRAAAVGAVPFVLPLMLQIGLGLTPLESGSITFIGAIALLLMKFTIGPTLKLFGFRKFLGGAGLLCTVFLLLFSFAVSNSSYGVLMMILFIFTLLSTMQIVSFESMIFTDIPPEEMGQASTMLSVIKQLAVSAGIAYAAFVLSAASLLLGDAALGVAPFRGALFVIAVPIVLTAVIAFRLEKSDGAEMAGQTSR